MNELMCPHCDSIYVTKSGQKNGKQRYKCKACGKKFTFGSYIKQSKNDRIKKKSVKEKYHSLSNKKFNFDELTIKDYYIPDVVNIPNTIELSDDILKIIDNDLKTNTISLDKYKNIIENLSSEQENEIARRLSNVNFEKIELYMNKRLFQNNHNEKLDALIIKILISTREKGIKILMEYINNLKQYKMTKYNLNVIGKHMCQYLDLSWSIIKKYIKEGISTNCVYTITRYINYVARLSYRELKNNLSFLDIRSIYFDRTLDSIFNIDKISDSDYLDNLSEYIYSLEKILKKMAKKELIDYCYLEQYNNSIFTENSIDDRLERASFITKNKNRYNEMFENGSKNIAQIPCRFIPAAPILTEKGIECIGEQLVIFYEEYCRMKFQCLQKDFDMWLDKYSRYIYTTILQYGIEGYKSFFCNTWGEEFIFKCKISTKGTEKLAEKICEEYLKNPRKDYSNILDNVFHNLLEVLNDKAINAFIYMIENKIITENDYLFYQNASFHFILGVTQKIYGDFYNIKSDYAHRRMHRGHIWEEIIGDILKKSYSNVIHHPILDNNKIPDYALIKDGKLEKIIECKLILGVNEFGETVKKYHSYCDLIEFYCLRNDIKESFISSDEYKNIMNNVSQNFKYEVKDFNEIYINANKYKEVLFYFQKNVKQITPKNLLKEKICTNFKDNKKEKILYLVDYTFSKSELF